MSQWLYAAMRAAGLAVELLETRHVRDAFKAMPVKSDRNDARGIAQLMRLGWFRPAHCKSMAAREMRALLTARKLVQSKLLDVQMSLRGLLRGFGLKVGPTTPSRFAGRIRDLVEGNATLEVIAAALLVVHETLRRELAGFEKRVRSIARSDERVRLLLSTPGVGAIVALTYVAAASSGRHGGSTGEPGGIRMTCKPYDIPKTLIWEAWLHVKANQGVAGIDAETIERFEKKLGDNLYKLWNRMSSGSYVPPPVKAVPIPKKSGGVRILGIPTVADRIAQTAVKM